MLQGQNLHCRKEKSWSANANIKGRLETVFFLSLLDQSGSARSKVLKGFFDATFRCLFARSTNIY